MDIKIDPNRLLSDELSYELLLRNLPSDGPVSEKRSKLREFLRSEYSSGFAPEYSDLPLEPKSEIKICTKKLEELDTLLENFNDRNYQNDYARLTTRLVHVCKRLQRIKEPEQQETKEELIQRCEKYLMMSKLKFSTQASAILLAEHEQSLLEPDVETEVEHHSSILENNVETEEPVTSKITSSQPECTSLADVLEKLSSVLTSQTPQKNTDSSYYPIHKWKVYYDGESNLSSFLTTIEELRVARGVNKQQLFNSAVEFFTGKALTWYRAKRDNIQTWDILVQSLRETFLPCDYEYNLWDEIKTGPREMKRRFLYTSLIWKVCSKD